MMRYGRARTADPGELEWRGGMDFCSVSPARTCPLAYSWQINPMTLYKGAPRAPVPLRRHRCARRTLFCIYIENDEPHPQVEEAVGFLITNCDPSRSSL
jgi:hypothetical protein